MHITANIVPFAERCSYNYSRRMLGVPPGHKQIFSHVHLDVVSTWQYHLDSKADPNVLCSVS